MRRCFECGKTKHVVNHHVVPRSLGGTATVPLCDGCHDKAHKARGMLQRWQQGNRKRNSTAPATVRKMLSLLKAGWPRIAIAHELNRLRIRPKRAGLWTGASVYQVLYRRQGYKSAPEATPRERKGAAMLGVTVPRYRVIHRAVVRSSSNMGHSELSRIVSKKYKTAVSASVVWKWMQQST